MIRISVVIPIYNAGDIIEHCITCLSKVLDSLNCTYEILLRDDGSTDGSLQIMRQLEFQYPQVKISKNNMNCGLGITLDRLFKEAQGESIIYCDCDLPFGAQIIPVLLENLESCGIVVASRYSGLPNRVPFSRKLFSRLYYLLCKILFDIPVFDIGSGSVALSKCTLKKLHLTARGFAVHTEFYFQALNQNINIKEIATMSEQNRPRSFFIYKHGFSTLIETIWLRLKILNTVV